MGSCWTASYSTYSGEGVELTLLDSLEIFLKAVFLWMVPAEAAFCMAGTARPRAPKASSRLPLSTAESTSLVSVFILVRLT